ncbi:MAG: hypothetical protein JWN44_7, partial [Myxococcales bacterium]|nr:hypothetical protein [Myxococcales bacterium]
MRRVILIAVVVGGCHFGVKGIDGAGGGLEDLGEAPADFGTLPAGSDLAGLFVPSHVDPGSFHPDATDLSGITTIDTTNLTLNGQPVPTGISFVPDPGHAEWAVLSVGGWNVDKNVRVTGTRSLVVVAARRIDVNAIIDASANLQAGGPGALAGGKGGDGTAVGDNDSGGGGGGFGSAGAQGG